MEADGDQSVVRLVLYMQELRIQGNVQARQKGYGGLLESGVNKALAGLTTAEEVISVAFTG